MQGFKLGAGQIVSIKTRLTDLTTLELDPAVAVSSTDLAVSAGATAEYRVVLATTPDSTVTVTPTVSGDAGVAVSPNSLSFTDWGVPQTVTVTASQDRSGASATIAHSAAGDATYAALSVDSVRVSALGICGRTQAVREAIVALVDGVEDCGAVTPAHLAAITGTLDLGGRGLSALGGGDLDGLGSLGELWLHDNALVSLPDLSDLGSLTVLRVDGNQITALPELGSLTALRALNVSGNQLAALPELGSLTALRTLDVSGNQLTVLPMLAGLLSLRTLWAHDNRLAALPALDGLGELNELRVSGNQLTALPDLSSVGKLTHLLAHNNQLAALPDVGGLAALRVLNLGGNKVKALPAGFVQSLAGSLQALGLEGFALTYDEVVAIKTSLSQLARLDLDPAVAVDSAAVSVSEGTTAEYRVVLATVPGSAVTITPAVEDSTAVTVLPETLTFTDWGVPQTVTVTAAQDTDGDDESVAVEHSSSGDATYADLEIASVRVGVNDDDAGALSALVLAGSDGNEIALDPGFAADQRSYTASVAHGVTSVTVTATAASSTAALRAGKHGGTLAAIDSGTASGAIELAVGDNAIDIKITAQRGAAGAYTVTVTRAASSAGGVCGRTPAVRDAIVALVTAASDCSAVTGAHLAAATGTLDVSGQSLTELKDGDFDGLGGLTGLDVSDNQLAALPKLDDLSGLTTLDAHSNLLMALPSLNRVRGLTALDVSDNRLTRLPSLNRLSGLTTLDVHNNRLTALPSLDSLSGLTGLNASNNRLTALPGLDSLAVLIDLDVSSNWLAALPNFDSLTALTALNASDNRLTALPGLDSLTALTSLDASDNRLAALPSLRRVRALTTLDVSSNQLKKLPELSRLTALTTLDASHNRLQSLPGLGRLGALTGLDVSHNRLKKLPSLARLVALTGLDVSDNQLKAPPDVSGLSALSSLDIGSNGTTALPQGYLDGIPAALESLGLRGFELTADEIVTAKTRLSALTELSSDAAVALSASELDVTEGQTAQYQIVLATRPSSAVTITATSSSPAAAVTPATLTFTDWGVAQTFTVAAPQDPDTSDATATISHKATGDAAYAAIAIDTARVNVTDDDSTLGGLALTGSDNQTVALSPAFASGTLAYTASVAHTTTAVTVTASIADATSQAAVTVAKRGETPAPATPGAPSGPVSLEVGANTIDVTVAAGTPDARTYTITVTRAQPQPMTVTLSATDTNPAEGATTTVTAALDGTASSPVTLVLTAAGTAGADDYTLSSTTIAIAAGERNSTAAVTITDDSIDDDGETITIKLTSTSLMLSSANVLTITIADNDSAPAAPSAPSLTGGDAKITATWTAPAGGLLNNQPTPTTGYEIRYRSGSGEWSVPIAATGTTATVIGLTNNVAHQLQVRALNITGPSPWSPAATATPAAAPGAPTGLTATAQLDGNPKTLTLNLTWAQPAGTVTGYRIQYKQRTATDWTDWPHTGTATTATISPAAPLAHSTTYDIRVAALNHDTPSTYTTTSADTPPAPPN